MPITTIGYGSRGVDSFCSIVSTWSPQFLVDVRSIPFSKARPDFSGSQLVRTLRSVGIRYVFMGRQLGGRPSDQTLYTNGYVDYSKLATTSVFRRGVARLIRAERNGIHLMLMCSEEKPENCHRAKLIGSFLTDLNVDVIHIDESGNGITQEQVLDRLKMSQHELFSQGLTSRRPYHPV